MITGGGGRLERKGGTVPLKAIGPGKKEKDPNQIQKENGNGRAIPNRRRVTKNGSHHAGHRVRVKKKREKGKNARLGVRAKKIPRRRVRRTLPAKRLKKGEMGVGNESGGRNPKGEE